jgi:cell division protein FtsQ
VQLPLASARRRKQRTTARPKTNQRRTGASKAVETPRRSKVAISRPQGPQAPSKLRRLARVTLRLAVMSTVAWGLMVGVQQGYDYATTSPRFEVRGLTFDPSAHVDDDELRRRMALPPGTNILSLDLDEVATRIAAHPWVKRASVVRVLPDTLAVNVDEYEPVAILRAGDFFLLDAQATPFKPLEAGERGELPVITGIDRAMMLTRPDESRSRLDRALAALGAYELKRRPRLSEISIGDAGELTLYTAELGTQLRLGRGDIERGLARYDALRAALAEEVDKLAIVHLDATAGPDRPDRVVASFFAAKEAPSLVEDAQLRADERAAAFEAAQVAVADAASKPARKTGAKQKSKLPRYH